MLDIKRFIKEAYLEGLNDSAKWPMTYESAWEVSDTKNNLDHLTQLTAAYRGVHVEGDYLYYDEFPKELNDEQRKSISLEALYEFSVLKKTPLFWCRPRSDGGFEGPIPDSQMEESRKLSGVWIPLFSV